MIHYEPSRSRFNFGAAILLTLAVGGTSSAQTTNPNVVEFLPPAGESTAGSVTYVSDLAWTTSTNGWGAAERDRSNGEQGAADGGTLTLNGVQYGKGIGAHAPSSITFDVPATCTTFLSDVGVDDEVSSNGSVVFEVIADGAVVFNSGVMTGSSDTRTISVNLAGRRRVQLVVSDAGDNVHYDHADWANARLGCGGSSSTITRYDVAFYEAGSLDPFMAVDIGMPAPQADGMIRVDFSGAISAWPLPNVNCEARVVAVTASGPAVSYPSNTFVYSCNFGLTSTAKSFPATGGSGSVALTSEGYCGWTASTTAPWISVTSGASGTGPATVSYSVAPNTSSSSRIGVVTIAGIPHTVTQAGTTSVPPVISRVSATAVTSNAATITWSTDVPADSQVEYGTTTTYGALSSLQTTLTTAHTVQLSGLTPGTLYHYRVRSGAANGGFAALGDYTFTTATSTTSNVRYLSDLAWASMTNGWGDAEPDRSNGELEPADGGPITLNGVMYSKGLGTHALSELRYAIPATCTQFVADIGLDDEVGPNGSVVFEVWADSTMLFRSALLTGDSPTVNVAVPLSGQAALRLVVTDGGDDVRWDHADWAGARLVCGTSIAPPNTPPTVSITRPSGGTSLPYRSGNALTIEASAGDIDGTIAAVYFFVNDVAIGVDADAQYSIRWAPPSRGTFSISAVAADNKGATTRSSPITVTIR